MDRPERRCGERREDERMRGDRRRNAFRLVARKPSRDEEVGVAPVPLRARRTARLASIAAGHEHEARSLRSRRPSGQDCARPSRHRDRLAFQAYRRGAAAGPADQLHDCRCAGAIAVSEHRQGRRLDQRWGRRTDHGSATIRPARRDGAPGGLVPLALLHARRSPGTTRPAWAESPRRPRTRSRSDPRMPPPGTATLPAPAEEQAESATRS